MTYSGTIVTAEEMTFYSGAGVSAVGNVEANQNFLAGYAEAFLSNFVKYDIVTNWATLNATYKLLFSEWAGRFAAVSLMFYDTAGYSSLIEVEDYVTVHLYRMQQIEKILENADIQDFIGV